jgi:hypothetical protein
VTLHKRQAGPGASIWDRKWLRETPTKQNPRSATFFSGFIFIEMGYRVTSPRGSVRGTPGEFMLGTRVNTQHRCPHFSVLVHVPTVSPAPPVTAPLCRWLHRGKGQA